MRFITRSLQSPTAKDHGSILAQHRYFNIRECQYAHFLSGVVALFVAIQNHLPTAIDAIAGNEHSVRRTVVAFHVAFDVAAIPRVTLHVEHRVDGSFAGPIEFIRLRRRCGLSKEDNA